MIFNVVDIVAALPEYAFGAELGRGGYGVVLAARHRETGDDVAVKVLVAGGTDARERFHGEAAVLTRLRHPHLVEFRRYVETPALSAIVMELLPGDNLRARLRAAGGGRGTGPLDPAVACAVVLGVAGALHHAHRHGVLHRDVKPANVLFTGADAPKISDFGIARVFDESLVLPSAVVGTPQYMAPEQFDLRPIGPATDLYALGVVSYEMLAGRPPFDPALGHGSLMRHHLAVAPPVPAGVPGPLARVVLRALAKDSGGRQPSLREFAVDVAVAATVSLGPDWLARSGVPVELDDDVLRAARPRPRAAPAPTGWTPAWAAEPEAVPATGEPVPPDSSEPLSLNQAPDGTARTVVPDLRRGEVAGPAGPAKPARSGGWRVRHPGRVAAGVATVAAVAVALVVAPSFGGGPEGQPTLGPGAAASSAGLSSTPDPTGQLSNPDPTVSTGPPTSGPTTVAPPVSPPASPSVSTTSTHVFTTVTIFNDSRIPGLAQEAVAPVEAAGFTVDRVGNFTYVYNTPVTTVFYDPEDEAAARTMVETVAGVERMVPRNETSIQKTGTLILVVTKDFPVN